MKTIKELPFKLFIFDLDGTALGGHKPYEQFPPEFAGLLDKLADISIKWATATTWKVDKQLELIRSSGVKSDPVLLTGCTGRSAFAISGNKMFPVTDYMDKVSELDSNFVKKYGKIVQDKIAQLQTENCVEKISYNRFGHHVISFKAANGKTQKLRQILQPLIDTGAYYPSVPDKFDSNSLLPEHMNKGRAVKLIQKVAGITPEETLIAGDETNDFHMFDPRLAKYMACPHNAHTGIKKIVMENNGIIASKNYSYGIIEAVNKILSIKP
jgi:hydroxymethylpyrimidine pyrophosphatase-like HAD family hydrolase